MSIIIPEFLSRKLLPCRQSPVIDMLSNKYNWKSFNAITENELKKVYSEDFEYFWPLIKILAFHGVGFYGKLNRFNFNNESKNITLIQLKTNDAPLDFENRYAFLKLYLEPYGINKKSDLDLIPLSNLVNANIKEEILKKLLIEDGFSFISTNDLSTSLKDHNYLNETLNKVNAEETLEFVFNNELYCINKRKGDYRLDENYFPASKLLDNLTKKYNYKYVKDLPKNIDFLTKLPYIGVKSVEKFFLNPLCEKKSLIENRKKIVTKMMIKEIGKVTYKSETIYIPEKIYQYSIKDMKFSSEIVNLLNEFEIKTLGELPSELDDFFNVLKLKKKEKENFWLNIFQIFSSEQVKNMFLTFISDLQNNKAPVFVNEREAEILKIRLENNTLERIGNELGITRERVRQITKKTVDLIYKRYKKFFDELYVYIDKVSFIHIQDVFPEINSYDAHYILGLFKLLPLEISVEKKYISAYEHSFLVNSLDEFYHSITIGKDDYHEFTKEDLEYYVKNFFNIKLEEIKLENCINDLIENAFLASNDGVNYQYKHKFTKSRLCQIVFKKEFAEGLNVYKDFELFRERLNNYYPEKFNGDNQRSIISNLTREDNIIVLWRIGFFKHISAINPDINTITLKPIKKWLRSQLTKDIEQINTSAAFNFFQEDLLSLGIDNEHALFSLLKIYYPNSFDYYRSPTIAISGFGQRSKKKVIEKFLAQKKKEVNKEELTQYFTKQLGWTETMLEQNISVSSLIIKTNNGYIHLNSLKMNDDLLQKILKYADIKMKQLQRSYSVEALFNERKSTFLQMGIKDSRILYHIMEKFFSKHFVFHRYPLVNPMGEYKIEQLSSSGQFEKYFIEQNDCLTREELYKEFVINRGWKESSFYSAFSKNKNSIVQIFPSEYAHIDLIGWNADKQIQFEEVLEAFILNFDARFIHIEKDILNNQNLVKKLPSLDTSFHWSFELIGTFVELSSNFKLLGKKKALLISTIKAHGMVKDEHEFISYLIRNKFNGYVKIPELSKLLYSLDLCGQVIPETFISDNKKELDYVKINDELILKELVGENEFQKIKS
ncbi:sigma factor-like helix-turn-helix DNA-binding protein [Marinococcus halophilus]|uniref:sigma factor-like helix-turn-helix DNA-binding protein n=1 Tax=Marinococcus halophilus TaxID=1371 RepID=UPI0009A5BA53|nr:sigma factor-like helix-turn-helix DNA-binding protein [Marinococcus halophilus]